MPRASPTSGHHRWPRPHTIAAVIEFDLDWFATAVRAHGPRWERASIRWNLTFGPQWDKSAAWVACDTDADEPLGQLTVWTSGEAELITVNTTTGAVDQVHYDLADAGDLDACLDTFTRKMTQQP